jgi:hypothetical protein
MYKITSNGGNFCRCIKSKSVLLAACDYAKVIGFDSAERLTGLLGGEGEFIAFKNGSEIKSRPFYVEFI